MWLRSVRNVNKTLSGDIFYTSSLNIGSEMIIFILLSCSLINVLILYEENGF